MFVSWPDFTNWVFWKSSQHEGEGAHCNSFQKVKPITAATIPLKGRWSCSNTMTKCHYLCVMLCQITRLWWKRWLVQLTKPLMPVEILEKEGRNTRPTQDPDGRWLLFRPCLYWCSRMFKKTDRKRKQPKRSWWRCDSSLPSLKPVISARALLQNDNAIIKYPYYQYQVCSFQFQMGKKENKNTSLSTLLSLPKIQFIY